MHIQRINAQVVRRQVQALEHLLEREVAAISKDDDLLLVEHSGTFIVHMSECVHVSAHCGSIRPTEQTNERTSERTNE